MFLKKLDWISPEITLYFKGESSHVSIYSAILSIIAYIILTAAAIYYALNFINREAPKAYFFTRYVEDAGVFPVNATQMFSFIQISDFKTNEKIALDFSVFRIVGFDDVQSNEYMKDPSIIKKKNHWLYGNCNNDSDTIGISYLIDQDFYYQSACIRKYYDASKKEYFNTNQDGFRWPVILKGCSNPERTYYGIIMQRCDEADDFLKGQGPNCKTKKEIDTYIDSVSFNFQIIDHYADMLNYEMPFTKYFYEVTSAITPKNFIIQHLNFNPASMLTHNGFFFDNQINEKSYFFTQNEKQTITEDEETITNGCLIGVFFWMQNTLQYYERSYDRIQDTLSDIGGISSIVLTIASFLNLFIHNFIILLDTKDLILESEKMNNSLREMTKTPVVFRRANHIKNPPRRAYLTRNAYLQAGNNIYSNSNFKEENNEKYHNTHLKRKKTNNTKYYATNNVEIYEPYTDKYPRIDSNTNYENKNTTRNLRYNTNIDNKGENNGKPSESEAFHWCIYLKYIICCRKNNQKMSYYEDLRAKIISEENIIQNYFDIYKLLKVRNIRK